MSVAGRVEVGSMFFPVSEELWVVRKMSRMEGRVNWTGMEREKSIFEAPRGGFWRQKDGY